MTKYNSIIIEDEPLAMDILVDYIKQVPFLELKRTCTDALQAFETIQSEKIDLIFLDIHLPKLKGLEFLESLKNPPYVIITSAYKEYALQGYELDVLDYLLKPIRFSRFLKAVGKIQARNFSRVEIAEPMNENSNNSLFFNVGKKKVKIFLDEIIYVESVRDYVKIITQQKTILTKFQLNQIEETLSQNNFLRVHRSFIVSRSKITAFTATEIELTDISVPIGRSYKELVTNILSGK